MALSELLEVLGAILLSLVTMASAGIGGCLFAANQDEDTGQQSELIGSLLAVG